MATTTTDEADENLAKVLTALKPKEVTQPVHPTRHNGPRTKI